jgi:hypothetical protein
MDLNLTPMKGAKYLYETSLRTFQKQTRRHNPQHIQDSIVYKEYFTKIE